MFPLEDPVAVFGLVMAVILVAPMLMERLRIPGIVGFILAGVLLGPNALRVLARDQAMVLLGTVGLLYIMFTAALDIDLAAFRRDRLQSIVFGVLTFAVPMAIGVVAGLALLGFGVAASVLLASMFASHTLVAYPVASRLEITKDPAVTATVGGTMITDTAALLVLAVIAGMARGEVDEMFWVRLGASLILYLALIFLVIPRIGRWFFLRMSPDGASQFVFVLAIVFLTAALAHPAGMEPLVGAFLAGAALNPLVTNHDTLMDRLRFTGEVLFIPFFLLSVGMLVDPAVLLGGSRAWIVALVMTGTVLLAKWLAAQATRILLGYSPAQGHVMFGLSVAQAAATLAAVIVGFEVNLFDEAVVNGTIIMILVTVIVSPAVVQRYGRRVAGVTR